MVFCGMATINSIRIYTDPKDYELIVMQTGMDLWDGHETLGLKDIKDDTIYIKRPLEQDQGNSADMNEGAKLAHGEYLVFIENDVILHENWLPNMLYYLEHDLADVVVPTQYRATWETMKEWKDKSMEEGIENGLQDAGMLMIRKDKFEQAGGWNEKIKQIYMWKAFVNRLNKIGARIITTQKVFMSHITGISYWWQYMFDSEHYGEVTAQENKDIEEDK